MRAYVTGGGIGFIGGHVVRVLRERGIDARDEYVDLLDGPELERSMRGCDALVHVAALYSYDRRDAAALARVNIGGTRTVLAAAARAGVRRIVHTSSAGTCGPVAGRPATEEDAPPAWELAVPYKRTKLEAERLALAAGAMVVNPTTPIGEGDSRPTPTGAMVRGVASGRSAPISRTRASTSSTCGTSRSVTRSRSSAGAPAISRAVAFTRAPG